jgi:hypothetical protein
MMSTPEGITLHKWCRRALARHPCLGDRVDDECGTQTMRSPPISAQPWRVSSAGRSPNRESCIDGATMVVDAEIGTHGCGNDRSIPADRALRFGRRAATAPNSVHGWLLACGAG